MGWRLKLNQSESWSLHHVIDKGRDEKGKVVRHTRVLSEKELISHGFDPKWKYQVAKEFYQKNFQAKEKLKRDAESKARAQARVLKFQRVESAHLPENLVNAFEAFLVRRMGEETDELPKSVRAHWYAAQRLIKEIGMDPTDYAENPEAVYRFAIKHQYSPSWLKKVLRLMNLWGYFYCKRREKAFLPMPPPSGRWKEKLNEAYFENRIDGLESAPLTPEMLEAIKTTDDERDNSKMKIRHWNWLYLSVWFGLRPKEICNLLNDRKNKYHEITKPDARGIRYLKIYQKKLISVPKEKRWKSIPILFPEQNKAIEIIKSQNFRRPLTKTIHNFVSEKHNTYAGRKNFLDLCLKEENGPQLFENVSQWLGHSTLDRSLRSYKQKDIVQYTLPPQRMGKLASVKDT